VVKRAVVMFNIDATTRPNENLAAFSAEDAELVATTLCTPATEQRFADPLWNLAKVRVFVERHFDRGVSTSQLFALTHALGFDFEPLSAASDLGSRRLILDLKKFHRSTSKSSPLNSGSFIDAATALFDTLLAKLLPELATPLDVEAGGQVLVRALATELAKLMPPAATERNARQIEDLAQILKAKMHEVLDERRKRGATSHAAARPPLMLTQRMESHDVEAAWPDAVTQATLQKGLMPQVGRKYAQERNAEYVRRLRESGGQTDAGGPDAAAEKPGTTPEDEPHEGPR
jgi:hypothetical protein